MGRHLIVFGLLAAGLLLAACGGAPPMAEQPALDRAALIAALRQAGATVEEAGEIEQEFFSVAGRVLRVNGAEVQVFEYADTAARQAESDGIDPGASSIGTTMVTWVDQPTFWAADRLIVLYVGAQADVQARLSAALGDPVAQGMAAAPPESPETPAGVEAARAFVARNLGVDPQAVEILSFEAVDWPDSCLGRGTEYESCAAVITPGVRVRLSHGGQEYVVRSDLSGRSVRAD